MIRRFILCLLFVGSFADAKEDDTIYLDATVISGNQELPRVLYVLPWRTTRDDAFPDSKPEMDLEQVMSPIFPHEHRRELAYRNLLTERNTGSEHNQSTKKSEED
jgi:hypothetical protein